MLESPEGKSAQFSKQCPWFDRAKNPQTAKSQHAPTENALPENRATPDIDPTSHSNFPVVIIGAGLSGCSLAWSLNRAGVNVTLIDAGDSVASAASGNSRAICRPQLNRNNIQLNLFYETAFHRTLQRIADLTKRGHTIEHRFNGLLQLLDEQGKWPTNNCATPVNAQIASDLAGIKLQTDALYFSRAGWVNAGDYCRALIADSPQTRFLSQREVIAKSYRLDRWELSIKHTPSNTIKQLYANRVVLACGPGIKTLCPILLKNLHLALTTSTGQTTTCQPDNLETAPRLTIAGKKYLIPEASLYTIGATHQRDISSVVPGQADDQENLQGLDAIDKTLANKLKPIDHWRSTRISTSDRLPIVGACPDGKYYQQAYSDLRHGPRHRHWPAPKYVPGLYLFTGLGSRGVVSAAFCADLLSAQIADNIAAKEDRQTDQSNQNNHRKDNMNQDTMRSIEQLLHPARFLIRDCKKGRC